MSCVRAIVAAVASAALLSCTLLVDLDGLAVPKTDAGANDAGLDSGAADASNDADAGPSNPCTEPNVLFCTRFDDPTSLLAFRKETDPTTRIEVQTSAFFSAPAAAAFTIDPSSNTSADATLAITAGTNVERALFRGRVRIEKRVTVDGRLLAMRIGNGSTIILEHDGSVRESGLPKLGTVPSIPSDQWIEIRMELDATAMPPKVTVKIGDTAAVPFTVDGGWTRGEVTAIFGISETSTPTPSSSWLVRWDDVAIQKL